MPFTKEQMLEQVGKRYPLYPICIPSYRRPSVEANVTLRRFRDTGSEALAEAVKVFVRPEELEAYRASFPMFEYVALPPVNGLASTRQAIADYMLKIGRPRYIDMDDDITTLGVVYMEKGKAVISRNNEVSIEGVLGLASKIADMAFDECKCVFGGAKMTIWANSEYNAQTAYTVNNGITPRQVTFMNAEELARRGIRRNMAFEKTGDDIGFVAEITKARAPMFTIPCVVYDFVPEQKNSVIRNDENRKPLAKYEYECLRRYPMGRYYLRINKRFEDGSYRFSNCDFVKYRKYTGEPKIDVTLSEALS